MMALLQQIAKHLREVYFGDNWRAVSLKDTLADVSWQQAVKKVHNLNTTEGKAFTLVRHSLPYISNCTCIMSNFRSFENSNY